MRRSIKLALLAWLLLVASGTFLHHSLWSGEGARFTQSIGNTLHLILGPAWVLLWKIKRDWPVGGWTGPLVVNLVGWTMWFAVAWALLRIRAYWLRPAPTVNTSRRRFLFDGAGAAAAVTGSGLLIRGQFIEPWRLVTRRYTVPIRGLPASLAGLRIVQISDTHLGPRIPAEFIASAVRTAINLHPDFIVLTGDYIHNGKDKIEPAAALFAPIVHRRIPVAAVLGNHDWYGDGERMAAALRAVGIAMVDNNRVYFDLTTRQLTPAPPPEGGLAIVGLGDRTADWIDAAAAFDGLDPSTPRIVLAHHPDTAEIVAGREAYEQFGPWDSGYRPAADSPPRIDLMLCGHTHGGQVAVPFMGTPLIPSKHGQRYAGGLVQGPGFPVCISRGVGMSVLPIRLGVPPELVEITLTPA